jgi:Aspartyl protease
LNILRPRPDNIATLPSRAILAAASAILATNHKRPRGPRQRREPSSIPALRYLLLAFLLLLPLPNRAHPSALRLPFRTVRSMILVQAKVNNTPVWLLLDTGATRTVVGIKAYGDTAVALRTAHRNSQGPGILGDSVSLPVNLELSDHIWVGQRVAVMNLDRLSQLLGIQFDGLLGQDILREFHTVRIDYHAHTIDLEN